MSFLFDLLGLIPVALFYALPMYAANMAPVLVSRLPILNRPIDGGRLWRGKPILGSHKTWRGFIAGILLAVAVVYGQRLAAGSSFVFVDYLAQDIWLLGVAMGFGALAGDAIKSFFKRRVGVKPGGAWPPFDQIDFIVGGLCAAWFYQPMPFLVAVLLLVLTPFGHVLVNRLAFAAGWKSVPY